MLASSASIRDTPGWAQLRVGDAAATVTTLATAVEDLSEVGTVHYDYQAAPEAALSMKLSSAEAAARKSLGTKEE